MDNDKTKNIFSGVGSETVFALNLRLIDDALKIVKISLPYDVDITQSYKSATPSSGDTKPAPTNNAQIDKESYIKPALVHISAGSYTMGSDRGRKNEKPTHKVTIDYDFEIGKYEVTIGEYKECVADGGCKEPVRNDYYKKMCLEDSCPAIGVDWNSVKAYTKWLSQKTGDNYRLPTELEWEYIARAGTATKWSFGDDERQLKNYAWYSANSDGKTHPVGTKKSNPWGSL